MPSDIRIGDVIAWRHYGCARNEPERSSTYCWGKVTHVSDTTVDFDDIDFRYGTSYSGREHMVHQEQVCKIAMPDPNNLPELECDREVAWLKPVGDRRTPILCRTLDVHGDTAHVRISTCRARTTMVVPRSELCPIEYDYFLPERRRFERV